nr:MAG TPA: hypothetical protein [Caudoviricetes sp.]
MDNIMTVRLSASTTITGPQIHYHVIGKYK